jgi:prepilin-type N-terminal cleavage/methylation domain-containing protein
MFIPEQAVMVKKAFTLIEVLVVIVIIGIISAIVAFSFKDYSKNTKAAAAKENNKSVCKKVDLEFLQCKLGAKTSAEGKFNCSSIKTFPNNFIGEMMNILEVQLNKTLKNPYGANRADLGDRGVINAGWGNSNDLGYTGWWSSCCGPQENRRGTLVLLTCNQLPCARASGDLYAKGYDPGPDYSICRFVIP